jgi:uncharacterized coiled-coil protein SlyX
VVRRINDIKKLLAQELTIDEIRQQFLCAASEMDELEESIARVFARLEETLATRATEGIDLLQRDLGEAERAATVLTAALRRLEERLGAGARLERRAV